MPEAMPQGTKKIIGPVDGVSGIALKGSVPEGETAVSEQPLSEDAQAESQARHLDDVCNQFEAAWKVGVPRIEDFLGTIPDDANLLRELVALDLFYRQRRGEAADPADYGRRFPALNVALAATPAVETLPPESRSRPPTRHSPSDRSATMNYWARSRAGRWAWCTVHASGASGAPSP